MSTKSTLLYKVDRLILHFILLMVAMDVLCSELKISTLSNSKANPPSLKLNEILDKRASRPL